MLGSALLSALQREVSQPEAGFGGHWSDSGDRLGDHGPSGGHREAVVHHGRRRVSHAPPPNMPASQHGLRAGAALPQWGGDREHTTLGPPALLPPPPHIRGGAQPVQSRQLPSETPPCG